MRSCSELGFGLCALGAGNRQLRAKLRKVIRNQRLFGRILRAPTLDFDQALLLRIGHHLLFGFFQAAPDLIEAILQKFTRIGRGIEAAGEVGLDEILGE